MLRPLVNAAHEVTPLSVALADAEYASEHNTATCTNYSLQRAS